ncbi:MAG: RsmD family RNA methyltransferase [Bacteroidota bacterium]
MRIVGGKFKGRIFNPGKSFKARPTTDFAKENLFNILENRIDWESTDALDLFSGTGSISYELISRGCRRVTSVEMIFRHYRFIGEVKALLEIGNLNIVRDNVFEFIEKHQDQYDLIFADPPFDLKNLGEVPGRILASGLLRPGGLLIVEHGRNNQFSNLPGFREIRSYGSVCFSFFQLEKPEEN